MGLALVAFGYLCGAIPWGVVFARAAGVDPRRAGSGNIGATNVARTAGRRLGLATLVADCAKGAVPVLVARRLTSDPALAAAAGLAAFMGHVFPVTLGFRGGKGVATALGGLAALCPSVALVALATFALVVLGTRWVSVASIAGALVAAAAAWRLAAAPVPLVATAMAAIVVLRHRDNLRRLRAGSEPRISLHKV